MKPGEVPLVGREDGAPFFGGEHELLRVPEPKVVYVACGHEVDRRGGQGAGNRSVHRVLVRIEAEAQRLSTRPPNRALCSAIIFSPQAASSS